HLDQESVEALTLERQNYEGEVLIVTHSACKIREGAQTLIVSHHDKVEGITETYDDYLTIIGWEEEEGEGPVKVVDKPNRQDMKRLRSEMIIERGRELNPLKKKIELLENSIIKLEDEQSTLENLLLDPEHLNNSKKVQESS